MKRSAPNHHDDTTARTLSAELIAFALDNCPMMSVKIRASDGRILDISPNCERIGRCSSREALAEPDFLFHRLHPTDRDAMRALLNELKDGDEETRDFLWSVGDNAYRPFRGTFRLSSESHDRAIMGVMRDLSDAAARRRYQYMIDRIPDHLYLKDRHSRFVVANRSVARILGFDHPDEMIGKTDFDLFGEETAQRAFEREQEAMRTDRVVTYRTTFRSRGEDAERRRYLVTKTPVHDADGQIAGIVGLNRDMTELVEAQSVLDKAISSARCLIWIGSVTRRPVESGAPEFVWDIKPLDEEMAQRFLPIDTKGDPYMWVFHESHSEDNRRRMDERAVQALLNGDDGYTQEFQCVDSEGRVHWMYEDVFVDRIAEDRWELVGVVANVSPEREAEIQLAEANDGLERAVRQLQRERDHLRTVMDSMPMSIYLKDKRGRYLHVNRAKLQAMGRTKRIGPDGRRIRLDYADVIGKTYAEVSKYPERGKAFHDEDMLIAQTGEAIVDRVRRNEKSGAWDVENKIPVRDEAGNIIGVLGSSQDITDRKNDEERIHRLNRELSDANAQLVEALDRLNAAQEGLVREERLRALGQMASGIAHDFNNLLAPMLGFTELLLERPENLSDVEKARVYLEHIRKAATDAREVIGRLREFYRFRDEDETLKPVDLVKTAKDAAALTETRWKSDAQAAGVSISMNFDFSPLPLTTGNEAHIRETITNLIFNACDAIEKSGTITIASCVAERTLRRPAMAQIKVSDTGCGMSPETLRSCMEPFFTTKSERGTGMGLSICYGVMSRHGGHIDVHSVEGQGATFTLSFPIRDEQGPNSNPSKPAGRPSRRLRILVVDDDPIVREVTSESVAAEGHRVTSAASGSDALRALGESSFDLLITDRAMPGMNGDELASRAKELNTGLPIVMLTGFGVLMDEAPPHVDVLVSKPISVHELRGAIDAALDG